MPQMRWRGWLTHRYLRAWLTDRAYYRLELTSTTDNPDQRIAEDLAQYDKWRPMVHSLGEVEVKHGARLTLFNFFSDTVGNPNVPEKLKQLENSRRVADRIQRKHISRNRLALIGVILLALAGLLAVSYRFLIQRAEQTARVRLAETPAKSMRLRR